VKQLAVLHPFAPVYDRQCRILILGSFPSVKSREYGFYYGHPQNRFWKVLARLLECPEPVTIPEKKNLLLSHHIALWDVLKSCDIQGSADASIQNPVANDLQSLIKGTQIRLVACNGATAFRIYQKHLPQKPDLPVICLPSTSPANAKYRLDDLVLHWKQALWDCLSDTL
jgi:TDG/mug DNA glycosylase family protein